MQRAYLLRMKHEFARFRSLIERHSGSAASGLDHQTVLARGYSLTLNLNGEIVRDDAQVKEGEALSSRETLRRKGEPRKPGSLKKLR